MTRGIHRAPFAPVAALEGDLAIFAFFAFFRTGTDRKAAARSAGLLAALGLGMGWLPAPAVVAGYRDRRQRAGTLALARMTSVLAPGLLLSAPPLSDPNFERSVVLLSTHGPEGAFGWVLNGKQSMSFSELLVRARVVDTPPDLPGVVRVGGPVSPEQVWLVYPSGAVPPEVEGQMEVSPGIWASASRKVLESIANSRAPRALITLMGYAGWAPWQLENEIRVGAWLPTDVNAEIVFDTPPAELWARAYQRVGASPMSFNTRTVGSA